MAAIQRSRLARRGPNLLRRTITMSLSWRLFCLIAGFGTWALPNFGAAQVVAKCGQLEGYSHYPYRPPVPKSQSGFQKDRVTGGLTTLQKLPNGEYDILIVDARKQVISYRQDGGRILLLRRGRTDSTFLVVFAEMAIELYTFYWDADGISRFDLMTSKGGDRITMHKSSLMTGQCSELNLDLIS